jgi:hypothetical protein
MEVAKVGRATPRKAATGIIGLDEITGGGLPRGAAASVVVRREDAACGTDAGAGRESFRGRAAQRRLGEPSFHLTSTITGGGSPGGAAFCRLADRRTGPDGGD